MFNKVVRFYNQNRKKIITIVVAIAGILIAIQLANYMSKSNSNKSMFADTGEADAIRTNMQTQSVITKEEINTQTATINNNLIDKFIEYCNNKDLESAYSMLSTDCKENVFNTMDDFTDNYYNVVFSTNKNYTKENWLIDGNSSTTYIVKYYNNLLADGGYKNGETFADYITVVIEDNQAKLNINQFVGSEEINKQYEDENVNIKIISKVKYINYERYKIEFVNKAETQLGIYNPNNTKWYVTDNYDAKYTAKLDEITSSNLEINKNASQMLNVKFLKPYNTEKKVKTIEFEKMYLPNNYLETIKIEL